jgi:hypothetical protein
MGIRVTEYMLPGSLPGTKTVPPIPLLFFPKLSNIGQRFIPY